jgi:hypothetical protein
MTPLTKPEVDANALETSVLNLWYEFLTRYFDGQAHDVGAVAALAFPKAELHFQQSAVSQPLDKAPASGVAITMVWSEGDRRKWTAWSWQTANQLLPPIRQRQEICYERVAWNFWVRATGSNRRANGKLASDRLFGLLGNRAETHALGQKGICRLKAAAPRAIQDTDYVLRLVTVAATLRYPIFSQTTDNENENES